MMTTKQTISLTISYYFLKIIKFYVNYKQHFLKSNNINIKENKSTFSSS